MSAGTEMAITSAGLKHSVAPPWLRQPTHSISAPVGCEQSAAKAHWDIVSHRHVKDEAPNLQRSARRVPLPAAGSLTRNYDGAVLAEAYAVCLPARASRDSFKTAQKLFASLPIWFQVLSGIWSLMTVGNRAQGFCNSQRSNGTRRVVHIGDLHIYSYLPDEIIVGWENKHLSFRVAVLLTAATSTQTSEMIVTTAAHCHDSLGKKYLKVISPFYRSAIRSRLQYFATSEWNDRAYFSGRNAGGWNNGLKHVMGAFAAWGAPLARFFSWREQPPCAACAAEAARASHRDQSRLDREELFYPPYRDMYPRLSKTDHVVLDGWERTWVNGPTSIN
jgi:hypothetical protein